MSNQKYPLESAPVIPCEKMWFIAGQDWDGKGKKGNF
jgi:hypothetical protein